MFPRLAGPRYRDFLALEAVDAISIDQSISPQWMRDEIQPHKTVQGNLDPAYLVAGGEAMEKAAQSIHRRSAGLSDTVSGTVRLSAEEALRIGLINRVVPADDLKAAVTEICMTIAENAPLAIYNAKINIDNIVKDRADRDMAACEAATAACMASQDYVEGRTAFMEKRKPVFKGK